MSNIDQIVTQFNASKDTLNNLYALECSCVYRACSKLFCFNSPLTMDQINNFIQTIPTECQRCTDIKTNLQIFTDLKSQIADYVNLQITPP